MRDLDPILFAALVFVFACGCGRRGQTSLSHGGAQQVSAIDVAGIFATNELAANLPSNTLVREVQPGVFELGEITIDQKQRAVSFPGRMNFAEGAMEYFLVTTWGKLHESIFRTETEPRRIHIAMLLLGAKGAGTNAESALENMERFIAQPSSSRLPGDAISLEVAWQEKGRQVTRRAEEMIFNAREGAELRRGMWIYNGSFVWEQTLLADREGSIVSLITDPLALINNVAPGHDNQAIWSAATNSLPPADVPVRITIRLIGP